MAPKTDEEGLRSAVGVLAELAPGEMAGWTPAERTALLRLGRSKLRRGEWTAACGLLEYAALLGPDAAETWELVAGARAACGRWSEALAAVEVANALERTWRRAALAALCCARQGNAAAAERWRRAAWAVEPDDPEEHRRRETALGGEEGAGA